MPIRATAAIVTAMLASFALALVGCSGGGKGGGDGETGSDRAATATTAQTPTPRKSVDPDAGEGGRKSEGQGKVRLPDEPDAATRARLIRALSAISPALVADEDKAVASARSQCAALAGGSGAESAARSRFSSRVHKVTHAEARRINAAVSSVLCH
ncbi:hypothetical protein [Streptomyces sp. NPDC005907]|uniref:hypothetical protein n=1 Tax=Streptomyces sp. NPDC005907 TaxID=3154571 RepID=UPI0033D077D6